MNAPPFPINPSVGEWAGAWVWNGVQWVASPTTGLRQNVVTFAASGPYMPSAGLVSCNVECVGGGGGGGGVTLGANGASYIGSGGGGGAGGYSRKTLPGALVRGGVMVTVGAGGVFSEPGTSQASGNGTATTFGAFCSANGGSGGNDWTAGTQNVGQPGTGGAAGIGDLAFAGATGYAGTSNIFTAPPVQMGGMGGNGGQGFFGGAPGGGDAWIGGAVNGHDGSLGTGSGGAGGVVNQVANGTANGGQGGDGICVVTETLWGDRDQPDIGFRPPLDVNLNVTQRPPWPPGPPPPWPPGWPPNPPWPPGWWGPWPWPRGTLPQGREFEADALPYGQDPQAPEDP